MPTSPFTPITRDSNVWSAPVKALLTDGMVALINKSPTLRAQLNQLSEDISVRNSDVKQIQLVDVAPQDSAKGSTYAANANTLFIYPDDLKLGVASFNADARFVGILAHEMGHRIDDVNIDKAAADFYGKAGQDERYTSIMVHSEGVAAANAFIVRKEILQTGENKSGPEIYFPGATYNRNDDVLKGLTRLDSSTASWDAPSRLQVFSEVGANYLAVANPGTDPSNSYWPYYLNSSRAARGLPAAPAPEAGSVELADSNHDGVVDSVKYVGSDNVCRREGYTTDAAGNNVTVKSAFTNGFNSPLANQETATTNSAGTETTTAKDTNGDGVIDQTIKSQTFDDGTSLKTTTYPNGKQTFTSTVSDTPTGNFTEVTRTFTATGELISTVTTSRADTNDANSPTTQTVISKVNGQDLSVTYTLDANNTATVKSVDSINGVALTDPIAAAATLQSLGTSTFTLTPTSQLDPASQGTLAAALPGLQANPSIAAGGTPTSEPGTTQTVTTTDGMVIGFNGGNQVTTVVPTAVTAGHYEFSSWSRMYLLVCSTKRPLKIASNDDFERIAA